MKIVLEQIVIRPITLEDIEEFRAAVDAVARERRWLARFEAAPLEGTRDFVSMNIENGYPHLVAEEDGRIVGWCDVNPRNTRDIYAHVGILGIGLVEGYRDRGLGHRLIVGAIEAAWVCGFARIQLTARADNARAIRLYERVGFVHEGRLRANMRVDGVDHDEVVMGMLRSDTGR